MNVRTQAIINDQYGINVFDNIVATFKEKSQNLPFKFNIIF
jgi:hypothetical protein